MDTDELAKRTISTKFKTMLMERAIDLPEEPTLIYDNSIQTGEIFYLVDENGDLITCQPVGAFFLVDKDGKVLATYPPIEIEAYLIRLQK